jgi:four helix bundle protein
MTTLPPSEAYGLTSQLRRSATSVALNIAEGHGRQTSKDFARFLAIARGSAKEVQTALELAHRLGYLSDCKGPWDKYDTISKMLYSLIKRLSNS